MSRYHFTGSLDPPGWLWPAIKFGTKGGVGVVVNVALLTGLVDVVGIPARWAIFVAWVITLVPGYIATDKLVFSMLPSPQSAVEHGHRGAMSYAVMWIGKGTNYILYLMLLELGLFYQAAWVLGAIAVFPLTFGANYWLWRTNPTSWREAIRLVAKKAIQ